MTSTTPEMTITGPSRTPLLAAFGFAASAVLAAIGTFWDLTGNESGNSHSASDYWPVLGIAAVATAVVYGLVVRTCATGNPGRRAVITAVVAFLSLAVFWAGLPMVLVGGAVACALADKDKIGSFGLASKAALVLSAVVTGLAVMLAIVG